MRAKTLIRAAAVAALGGLAAVVALSGDPAPRTQRAWAPAFTVTGVHLAAAAAALQSGCTADFMADLPDGGQRRVQLRSDGHGGVYDLSTDAGFTFVFDAGVAGLE